MYHQYIKLLPHMAIIGLGVIGLATPSPQTTKAAGLLVAEGGFGGILEIKEHQVHVSINNGIAVTQIDQVFVNTENRIVEALYTFPVPRNASVSNFSMWIQGKEMIGEVIEKKRAREIYDSYKQTRRDPGLLEKVDFKRFEMRIFPIPAGAEQRVRIEYAQELNVDQNWATYVYPLASTTRSDIDSQVTGKFSINVDVKSEVPIVELRSESHPDDFVIVSHQPEYAQAGLEQHQGTLARDVVMAIRTERLQTGVDLVTSSPKGEAGYFMLTVTPGEKYAETNEPMDYVFLLDVSGSMAHDNKLAISRLSTNAFIEALSPEDRFDCLAFNLAPTPLFGGLRPATVEQQNQGTEFLLQQRARGGTVLQPALNAAYAYRDADRPLNVILLSDGMTDVGEQSELLKLIRSRPAGVRVFCVGIGNEVNRPLLQQMAKRAGGLAAFVSTEDNFARQAQLMRQKLIRPAIKAVQVQYSGGQIEQVEPQNPGDLFYGTPLRLFGRYSSQGPVQVTLTGTVEGAPWKETFPIRFPKQDQGNSEIERMWASKRVAHLMNQERAGEGSKQAEIVQLCEGYSIVSQYASMLVLENDAEYRRWKIKRRNAIRIERDRSVRQRLQADLAKLRSKADQSFHVDHKKTRQVSDPTNSPSPPSGQPRIARRSDIDREKTSPVKQDHNTGSSNDRGGNYFDNPLGGGAIEPFTAIVALGASAVAALNRRRRRAS